VIVLIIPVIIAIVVIIYDQATPADFLQAARGLGHGSIELQARAQALGPRFGDSLGFRLSGLALAFANADQGVGELLLALVVGDDLVGRDAVGLVQGGIFDLGICECRHC